MAHASCRWCNQAHRFFFFDFRHYFHARFFGFCKALWFARLQSFQPGRLRWFTAVFLRNWRRAGIWQGFQWCCLVLFCRWGWTHQAWWVKVILHTQRLLGWWNLNLCFDIVTMVLGVNLSITGVTAECWFNRMGILRLLHLLTLIEFWCCLCYSCQLDEEQD